MQREKDQNTFDSQRLTRLSPWELTLGKLFGPPLMADFIFLCFLPAAIIGAVYAHSNWTIVFVAYLILILGAIVFDALALVISLFLRRGTVTWAILAFLYILYVATSAPPSPGHSPFAASAHRPLRRRRLGQASTLGATVETITYRTLCRTRFATSFSGAPVHHALVLSILYFTLLLGFFSAAVRNIKRDPENYELYTPGPGPGISLLSQFHFVGVFFDGLQFFVCQSNYSTTVVPIRPLRRQSPFCSLSIL